MKKKLELETKFSPTEHVTVSIFDLGYPGRVISIVIYETKVSYNVMYAANGEIRFGEFVEDELVPRKA